MVSKAAAGTLNLLLRRSDFDEDVSIFAALEFSENMLEKGVTNRVQ